MNKIIKILIIGFFGILLTVPVYAKLPDQGVRFFCLAATKNKVHDAKLSIDTTKPYKPVPGNIWVFVRLNGLLTTGDPTLDLDPLVLGSRANYDKLNKSIGFGNKKPTGLTDSANPVSDVSKFPVNWHDDIKGGAKDHAWFGMQVVTPSTTVDNGGTGGQQQGTFNFATAKSTSKCNIIRWDPLGYVFDAQTLGVIPGAVVTITDANGVDIKPGTDPGQVATNPVTTLSDGLFSFFTDPGSYKLKISGNYGVKPGKRLKIAPFASITSDYGSRGYTNLYNKLVDLKQPIVEEAGQTVRSDIAVETVGAPAAPPLVSQFEDISSTAGDDGLTISGTITYCMFTHPNIVPVYVDLTTQTEVRGESLSPGCYQDPWGNFEITIPQTKLIGDKTYNFSGHLDLVQNQIALHRSPPNIFTEIFTKLRDSFFIVHAAQSTSSVNIDPIPTYLEGIARDGRGNVLPSAMVGLYLEGSNVPVYQTQSDVSGHYVIGSQYIPMLPYTIHFTLATGDVITTTTMDYLRQNSVFHKQNAINSFTMLKTNSSMDSTGALTVTKTVIPPASTGTHTTNRGNGSNTTQDNTQPTSGISASGMQGVVMIIVVILVLILIGVGAFIMMKSKQAQTPPQF